MARVLQTLSSNRENKFIPMFKVYFRIQELKINRTYYKLYLFYLSIRPENDTNKNVKEPTTYEGTYPQMN